MVRGLNCHSAFKHYEMFHTGGGGNNYGSIYNTTYDIDCGGHGNFGDWFGFGFGSAIGGLIGNFFAGGGFNNFFGGGFNFGNWGLNGNGGWNWGGGYNSTSCKCDHNDDNKKTRTTTESSDGGSTTTTTTCTNKDQDMISGLQDDANNLISNPDAAKLKALYDKVIDTETKIDEPHKAQDLKQLEKVKGTLQGIADANGWGKLSDDEFDTTQKPKTENAKENGDQDKITGELQNKANALNLNTCTPEELKALYDEADDLAKNLDGVQDDADKNDIKSFKDRLQQMANARGWGNITDDTFVEDANKIDDDEGNTDPLKGYQNYDGKAEIKPEDVVRAHDEKLGGAHDVKAKANGVQFSANKLGNLPESMLLETESGIKVVYRLQNNGQPNATGQYIYKTARGQEYSLEIGPDGKYHLIQRKTMEGAGEIDATATTNESL